MTNEFEIGQSYRGAVLEERMAAAAYSWPSHGRSTIGNRTDIERVPAENLCAFYQRYYQPDNAMLVVAGRFDAAEALRLVDRHFGAIPRPARELRPTHTVESVQDGEQSVVLRRSGDVAMVGVAYHTVAGADEDQLQIEAALHVLTDAPSGRLYQPLGKTGKANRVWSYANPQAEPGLAWVFAEVDARKPIEPLRDELIRGVESFSRPSDEEVTRFVNRTGKQIDLALTRSDQIAIQLSEYAAMGDWRLFFVQRDRLGELSPERVESAARRYFQASNRTVGLFIPAPSAARAPLPAQPDVAALVDGYRDPSAPSEGEVFEASAANIERRTERFDLASGMKVALLPKQTRGDAVQATLTIHYGSEAELQGKTSATRLMPSMLMRGTRKLDYQQIQDKLDALHAVVRVSATEPGQVTFQITTVGEQLAGMLDLLADVLTQPSFAPGELAVLRRDLISELETELQDPTEQGFNAALRAAQPAAPTDVRYLPTTAESIARVRAVKLADVKQLHQRLFGGGAAELAIVGDFEPAAAKRVLESRYANWRSPRPFGHIDRVYREAPAVSEKLDTPDKAMAFVVTALPVQIRDDAPEYPALALASFILGGAADSRLFARLREKEGWSYGAFSGLQVDSIDDLGLLYAAAALRRHIVAARLSRVVAGDLKQVELQ